ncbi:MAG: SUF system Fe-S cluster assembly protein [Sulfurifustis sp.]
MSETIATSDTAQANVPAAPEGLHEQVVAALKTVYDPEIPVNIYDLGLIYGLDIDADGHVRLQMTLTAPGCPVAQTFPATVQSTIEAVPGVKSAEVELVWDPPWSRERMTQEAMLQLGML